MMWRLESEEGTSLFLIIFIFIFFFFISFSFSFSSSKTYTQLHRHHYSPSLSITIENLRKYAKIFSSKSKSFHSPQIPTPSMEMHPICIQIYVYLYYKSGRSQTISSTYLYLMNTTMGSLISFSFSPILRITESQTEIERERFFFFYYFLGPDCHSFYFISRC